MNLGSIKKGLNGQKLISHRGNIWGPYPSKENHPDYIQAALDRGYEVEIDVWSTPDGMYLGHDEPQYRVDYSFLTIPGLWCHAKNFQAFGALINTQKINCFWHQEDQYTLTSHGWIWAYPGQPGNKRSIAVMPEKQQVDVTIFGGICSDVIEDYLAK